VLGCFLGAVVGELSARSDLGQGTKVGVFSAIGFVMGALTKTALAMAMSGWLMFVVLRDQPPLPAPLTP
jgi:uncharacterized protein YqgC (DUF456 family)